MHLKNTICSVKMLFQVLEERVKYINTWKFKKQSISNCYDEYDVENVAEVKRNGLVLSAIKKIK